MVLRLRPWLCQRRDHRHRNNNNNNAVPRRIEEGLMAERREYINRRQDIRVELNDVTAQRNNNATVALRILPPVRTFGEEDEAIDECCPICREVFKNGDLIQPFRRRHNHETNRVTEAATSEPIQTAYRIERLMAHQREYVDYSRLQQHTRPQHNDDDFSAKISIVRKALRVLPPVKSFIVEDKSNGCSDMLECSICMEVFKVGELIQPLGLCSHQFHSSCLYSWLHSGKSTCPLCRVDLATT
ncbi:hypothetical protein PIB30_030101 [Stylosanthes scabra]|uniref:RING-type domain-containing protein n=1 Tax=Stylosanthes scabra TaxID=79078 RepID=A0ABU6XAC5_9FABA|nr:hypothetical protein [Stylosanthes scabra]